MMTILWLETRDSQLHSFGELQNYHVWLAYQDDSIANQTDRSG